MYRIERILYFAALALVAWVMVTFMFAPIIHSFIAAFFRDGNPAVGEIASDLFASRRVRMSFWNSIWMTAATTISVTIMGVFQVMVLEYFKIKGRTILKFAFATPLVFGSIIAVAGYNFTYGRTGVVTSILMEIFPWVEKDWFIGWFGVLYTHTFLMTGFHFLFLRAAMRRIDFATIEAARSMGASEMTILLRIVLPVMFPTLIAVTLLTVNSALGSFSTPLVLGGRDFYMISEVILNLNTVRRQDMAALLAIILGVALMGLILLSQHYEAKGSYFGGSKTPTPIELKTIHHPAANMLMHAICYLVTFLYVLPLALVILFSFAPASSMGTETIPSVLTLKNYIYVLTESAAFSPFLNSMGMGGLAVIAGLSLTVFSVPVILKKTGWTSRFLDLSFFLPWLLPSILLAIGMIMAFDTPNILLGGGVLLGTYWIVPAGYTILVLPLMFRFLRAAFIGIDPAYEDAARSMGAMGLYRFRRIILPIIFPTILLVAGMTFNDLLTEYSLSVFLYNVNNEPLSIAILSTEMSTNKEQKAINLVYAVLIMSFTFAIIMVAERMGLGRAPKSSR